MKCQRNLTMHLRSTCPIAFLPALRLPRGCCCDMCFPYGIFSLSRLTTAWTSPRHSRRYCTHRTSGTTPNLKNLRMCIHFGCLIQFMTIVHTYPNKPRDAYPWAPPVWIFQSPSSGHNWEARTVVKILGFWWTRYCRLKADRHLGWWNHSNFGAMRECWWALAKEFRNFN